MSKTSPFILGVAGGSGSGKTYFAQALRRQLGEACCEIILQDSFYIDQSKNFDFDGGSVNFDHPDSLDFALLTEQLKSIKSGAEVDVPIYDFVTHSRKNETQHVKPKAIIIVDGILILHPPELRGLFDDRIYFDTPEQLRFERRLERDIKERGRSPEGVHNQFFKQVKPMHDAFVEPSRCFADTIVKEVGEFDSVLKAYVEKLRAQIALYS